MDHKQKLRRGHEKNRQDVGNPPQQQDQASLYRRILERATETSPFRSLTTRRERAERARRLNESY